MNAPITQSAGFEGRPSRAVGVSLPGQALFWAFQSAVLVALACTSFFPILFRYQEHAVIILFVLCLGMCWAERSSPWIRTPLDVPIAVFVLWVLATVPFATDPAYSFAEWKKFVAQVLVYYWSLLVLHRRRRRELPQQVLSSLVAGAAALSSYAIIEFLARGGTWRDRFIRAHAFGSDYNWLSTYMVMTIPVVAGLVAVAARGRWRAVQAGALVLTGAAQLFSYTRGGWLGHAAQGVMAALMVGGRRLLLGVLGAIVLVGAGLVVASQVGLQKDTVDSTTVGTRLAVWSIGLREVAASPLVGIGYGNNSFVKKFPQYSLENQAGIPERERVIPAMHSTFLMVALGSGLPALAGLLWIFVALLRRLLPVPWVPATSDRRTWLAVAIGLAVLGFGVRNCFDYMFMGSLAHVFWLLAAVGVTLTNPTWHDLVAGRDGEIRTESNRRPDTSGTGHAGVRTTTA
ncbi:MAG: O-antigen ligase family protein [Nitrospira sp.]|nr:MAG: O-antigen ligase family protein [Nitrospira sp.]